jgi:hypothetical protein
MPWWMVLYTIAFGLLAFFNICYLIYVKSKVFVFVYDLLAGAFLFCMMISYWLPLFREHLNLLIIPVFVLIIAIDLRITVYGDIQALGIDIPEEMTEDDMEIAGAVSLLFSAPAYIMSGLLCLETLTTQ